MQLARHAELCLAEGLAVTETIGPTTAHIDQQLFIQKLVKQTRAAGVELIGQGSLLTRLTTRDSTEFWQRAQTGDVEDGVDALWCDRVNPLDQPVAIQQGRRAQLMQIVLLALPAAPRTVRRGRRRAARPGWCRHRPPAPWISRVSPAVTARSLSTRRAVSPATGSAAVTVQSKSVGSGATVVASVYSA